ncbi:unnamed protein product, partial [Rotaria socialis]
AQLKIDHARLQQMMTKHSVNGFGETTSQELVQKLLHDRDLNVSRWTVQRQLKRMGYKSTLPYGTPMLTQKHKEARVQWAIQHKDDSLSFIGNNYEWSFLCSNSSRSSYPQC